MSRKSARKVLGDRLAPHLPGYKLILTSRNVDVPETKFVQISLKEFTPPTVASGFNDVRFIVTVVTPLTTPQRAEDDLDDLVADLLRAIDAIDGFRWEHAEKVTYDERHLAYDITVTGFSPTE